MKKNFFLTMLFALLSITTGMAQFAPEAGKAYALREITKGYYLDIQTLGMTDNNQVTNNISLNTIPCIIYFEEGQNGTWKMKNANSEYVCVGSNHWNPTVGGSTTHEWLVAEEDGLLTFQRQNDDKTGYIGAASVATGVSLYNNQTEKAKIFKFLLIDLCVSHDYYNMKAVNGGNITNATGNTYFSFNDATVGGVTTQASYSTTPANLYIPQTVGKIAFFQEKDNGYYINHTENHWNITRSDTPALYVISEPDANNYVSISKIENANHNICHDGGSNANINNEGTGIFTNVASDLCHKWELVKHNVYESTKPTFTWDSNMTNASYMQYLSALSLNGISILTGLEEPKSTADMYVMADNSGVVLAPGCEYSFNLTFPKNQTSQILVANLFIDKDGDGTYETKLEQTGEAGGNSNNLTTVTFTVPVDASTCYTAIRLRLDSSWAIAETATSNANRMVYDIPVTITPPPSYTFNIVNPSGETVTATYNGNAINEGEQINGGVNESLFSANDIEGYKWSIVVDNSAKTVTLVYVKKYAFSLVDVPNGVTITFDGNAVNEGDYIETVFDAEKLTITGCPNNYKWEFINDTENKKIIIEFTELVTVYNPQPVIDLLNRIGGAGTADKFKIVLDPSLNSYGAEQFVIGNEDGKILIKGSTLSAITTGIGWYLQNIAHINIAWNSLNEKTASDVPLAYADLSSITAPASEEVHTTDAEYRYYLNYCTFGYSMTSWTWERWQQEIDWMALHGINMPLQIIGLEEVWRKFLTMEDGSGTRKYNYTDEEAKAFVPGPAYTAWWGMNNLEGYGGTSADGKGGVQDDKWYTRQQQLATLILTRQRDLGMQPVLPGFSGMVPTNFTTKTTIPTDANGGSWGGFARPRIIDPTNERFAEIAADYYKCLKDVMGESLYYSMDPFHEGGKLSSIPNVDNDANRNSYKTAYKAVYDAMEIAKPGSQWVIQQWQWYWYQKVSVNAVPNGRMIVLDLFSDGSPAFDSYSGYAPQDAVFCAIPNFGGRSGLMGRLQNVTDNYFNYKVKYSSIKGIGAAPEAIEQTPVTYDLIFQLPWMNGVKPDVEEWVNNYAIARYGVNNNEIKEAWSLLRQGPLNYGADGIQGPIEDVWAARPNLEANYASSWGSTLSKSNKGYNVQGTYTAARRQMLIDATYKLLSQSDEISGEINLSNYYYDLVEFGGAVLADYAHYLLLGIRDAKNAAGNDFNNNETYTTRRDAFLQLIRDVDTFKGTNLNFRLGKWTQEARDAAEQVDGATTATPDWYEYNNARTLITTWGDSENNGDGNISNGLKDYSYRSWQGLLKDYYLPRWEYFFNHGCTHPNGNAKNYFYFEWNWAHGKEHYVGQTEKSNVALTADKAGYTDSYTREPEGNTVEVATEVLGKYIIPVVSNTGTYYAYRYLTNDLSSVCTVTVTEGESADLSNYFGELENVAVTGDFIDGSATNIKTVVIKSDATGDADYKEYTGTITINDGTVLTFKVAVNSAELATAKEGLAQLIEDMKELTAQVGVFDPARELPLTTKENKPFYVWTNAQEDSEGPIANLVDGSIDTYFHSEYSGSIGEYHFINVDLGSDNALSSFKFSYNTRKAETNFPKTIKIYGSNERLSGYKEIAEITDLPVGNTSTSIRKELDEIICNEKYAYLRFEVRANSSNNNPGGYPFFHMAEFDLYKLYTTATVYDIFKGTELTNEFAAEKYDVLLAAISVNEKATTPGEIATAKSDLQAAYDELLDKMPKVFNGVYKIMLKKDSDGNEYDNSPISIAYNTTPEQWTSRVGYKMVVTELGENADSYFTIIDNGDSYSFQAQGMYLKQQQDESQQWRHSIFSENENEAGTYLFEETEIAGIFKVRGNNGDVPYLNAWSTTGGLIIANDATVYSTFSFVPVTTYTLTVPEGGVTTLNLPFNVVLPTGVEAYDVVENEFETENGMYKYNLKQLAVAGNVLAKNTPVVIKAAQGSYTLNITMDDNDAIGSADGSALCGNYWERNLAAYANNYQLAVTAEGVVFNRVNAATTVAANQCWMVLSDNKGNVIYDVFPETPEIPDAPALLTDGGVYRIKGRLVSDTLPLRTVYTNGVGNSLRWTSKEKNDATTLFVVQATEGGKFKLVSALGNGLWNNDHALDEDGVELTLLPGTVNGTYAIRGNGDRIFSAFGRGEENNLNQYSNGTAKVDTAETTDFIFEKITDEQELAKVAFTKRIHKGNHFATLFLPYNVEVPEGVAAYTATIDNKDKDENDAEKVGYISLEEVEDGIIPARTAVILRREENAAIGEFSFKYTTEAGSNYDDNLFGGRVTPGYVGSDNLTNGDIYYLLLNLDSKGEALYKVYREYDSWGGYVGANNGGYIKCDANKGYMKLNVALGASSSYILRINGATGIEELEGEDSEEKVIYDLQGRKLTEITKPGFYIVNGEKVFVK